MPFIGQNVVWIALATTVIVLMAAEILVRILSPRVADLLEWRDWECQHKVRAIEALGRRGGASVVAVGPSLVNSAFDPHQATDLLGASRPAFNAALNAASFITLEPWILEIVLPALRPELVILGVNSSEFNDNNLVGQRGYAMFRRSIGWRRMRPGKALRHRVLTGLEKRSFLIRYRHFLREPGRWGLRMPFRARVGLFAKTYRTRFRKDRGAKNGVTALGKLQGLPRFDVGPYRPASPRALVAWQGILQRYAVGGSESAALARIADTLRRSGIPLLMVKMPVTQDWIDLHPAGTTDYEHFEEALERFVAERGIPLVDMRSEFPSPEEYTDATHLNPTGRVRFTSLVCSAAASLLERPGRNRGEIPQAMGRRPNARS